MAVPISQMWTVATYVLKQKLKGRKQYPLVLMLEPLFRCNLACAGCGKIQYPSHVLKMELTPEECFRAVEECGTPTVAIPGGEPLLHPQIGEIVEGLVARKKYIYLCTNALLLKAENRSVQAQQVFDFLGPHGWPARASRFFRVPGRRLRQSHRRNQRSAGSRLPGHHQYHAIRRRRSQECPRLLRRDDGTGCRRHDAFARLFL